MKRLNLPKHEKEALECLLDEISFYNKQEDKTDYNMATNEYNSILFALSRLGYNISEYRGKLKEASLKAEVSKKLKGVGYL